MQRLDRRQAPWNRPWCASAAGICTTTEGIQLSGDTVDEASDYAAHVRFEGESPSQAPSIRASTPADQPTLALLERRHFPMLRDQLFDDPELTRYSLDGQLSDPLRVFTSVAEIDGVIEGFATALPFSLPGTGQIDPSNMLLQYLAVNEDHRRQGLGRLLVEHIEQRIKPHRQNVIVAHVPAAETAFYRRTGWEVMGANAGFAWLPFNDMLRADFPDPQIGFEHMAAKILRPRAVRRWFGFPKVTTAPIADAAMILEALIARGDLDFADLDEDTRQMLFISQLARRPSTS